MTETEKYIGKFNDTKTLPHVVTRLSRLIADPEATMKDFESVIKMDPILVVRLLKLVNSPFFGLAQQVDSIGRAVTFIGMKNLHTLAVTDALKGIFKEKEEKGAFSKSQLWLHCAAVSICSKMLAERIFGINGDDAYLCGILHDFGLIVEEQVNRHDFLLACQECGSDDSLTEIEMKFLGTNHCEIGYQMTKNWDMSPAILDAIRNHHNYDAPVEPSSLTGIIQISEYITGQLNYTALKGVNPKLAPSLRSHIEENIDEYKVLIDDLPAEIEKAQNIYGEEK